MPTVCLLAITPVLAVAIVTTSIAFALPLRTLGEAAAPISFGFVSHSQYVFGGPAGSTGAGGGTQLAGHATGLEYTFLVFLVPLLCAGLLALTALRTHPRDAATATASAAAIDAAVGEQAQH